MKLSLCLLMLAVTAYAEVPEKKPVENYALLWSRSPFTSQPPTEEKAEIPSGSISSQWALRGVSEFPEGFQVTLASRKDPTKTAVLRPNEKGQLTVVGVERGKGSLAEMAVTLTDGQKTETLHFDPEIISPAKPAVKPPASTPAPHAIIVPES